eukprot:scaffold2058_cov115-Cylindrotheca_fusiformis.AAC.1
MTGDPIAPAIDSRSARIQSAWETSVTQFSEENVVAEVDSDDDTDASFDTQTTAEEAEDERQFSEDNVVAEFDSDEESNASFETQATAEEAKGSSNNWNPAVVTNVREFSEDNVVAEFDSDEETNASFDSQTTAEEAGGSSETWNPPLQQDDMQLDEEIDFYFHSPKFGFLKLNDESESEVSFPDFDGAEIMDDCGESSDGSIDIVAEMLQLHSHHQRSPQQQENNIPDSSPKIQARGERVLVSSPTGGDTVPARLVLPVQELLLFQPSSKWNPSCTSACSFFEDEIPPEETIQVQFTNGKSEWVTKQYIHLADNQDAESMDFDSTTPAMNSTTLDTAVATTTGHSTRRNSMGASSFLGSIACNQSCSGRPIMKCEDNILVVSDTDEEDRPAPPSQPPSACSTPNLGLCATPPQLRALLSRFSRRSFVGATTGDEANSSSLGISSQQQQEEEENDDCDMIPESPEPVSTAASHRDESPTRIISTADSSVTVDPSVSQHQEEQELTLDESNPPSQGRPSTPSSRRGLLYRLSRRSFVGAIATSGSSDETNSTRTLGISSEQQQQPVEQEQEENDVCDMILESPKPVSTAGSHRDESPTRIVSTADSSVAVDPAVLQAQEQPAMKDPTPPGLSSAFSPRGLLLRLSRRSFVGTTATSSVDEVNPSTTFLGMKSSSSQHQQQEQEEIDVCDTIPESPKRVSTAGSNRDESPTRTVSTTDSSVVDHAVPQQQQQQEPAISQELTLDESSSRTRKVKVDGLPTRRLSMKRILQSDLGPPPPPMEQSPRRTTDPKESQQRGQQETKESSTELPKLTRKHARRASTGNGDATTAVSPPARTIGGRTASATIPSRRSSLLQQHEAKENSRELPKWVSKLHSAGKPARRASSTGNGDVATAISPPTSSIGGGRAVSATIPRRRSSLLQQQEVKESNKDLPKLARRHARRASTGNGEATAAVSSPTRAVSATIPRRKSSLLQQQKTQESSKDLPKLARKHVRRASTGNGDTTAAVSPPTSIVGGKAGSAPIPKRRSSLLQQQETKGSSKEFPKSLASEARKPVRKASTGNGDATSAVSPLPTSIGGKANSMPVARRRSSLKHQPETVNKDSRELPELVSELQSVRKHARRASTGNEIIQESSKSMPTPTEVVQSFQKHGRRASAPYFTAVDPALVSQGASTPVDSPRTRMIKAREGLVAKQLTIQRMLRSNSLVPPPPPPLPLNELASGRTPDSPISSFKKVVSKPSSPKQAHRRNSALGSATQIPDSASSSFKKVVSKSSSTKRAHRRNSALASPPAKRATATRRNSATEKPAESQSQNKGKDMMVSCTVPLSGNPDDSRQEGDKKERKKEPKRGSSKSSKNSRRDSKSKVKPGRSSSPTESSATSSRKRAKKKKDKTDTDSQRSEMKKKKRKSKRKSTTTKSTTSTSERDGSSKEAADTEKPIAVGSQNEKDTRRLQVESNFQPVNDEMSSPVGMGVSDSSGSAVGSSLRKSLLQKRTAVMQSRQELKDTFKRIVSSSSSGEYVPVEPGLQKRKAVMQSRQELKDTFKRIVGSGSGGEYVPIESGRNVLIHERS